jgi:DNA repair protein RadC
MPNAWHCCCARAFRANRQRPWGTGCCGRSAAFPAASGVGPVRAAALAAAFGLARRLGEAAYRPGTPLRHGGDVARLVRDAARGARRESFFVILVDARHRLQSLQLVSLGGVDAAPVHPREVFAPAVRDGAAAIIVAHNHPSGDPAPSPEDRRVTERLRQVGDLIGIDLLDHIIAGADRFYSFADEGFFAYA